jgi:hypothetical protein
VSPATRVGLERVRPTRAAHGKISRVRNADIARNAQLTQTPWSSPTALTLHAEYDRGVTRIQPIQAIVRAAYPSSSFTMRIISPSDQAWNGAPRGVCGASPSAISDT